MFSNMKIIPMYNTSIVMYENVPKTSQKGVKLVETILENFVLDDHPVHLKSLGVLIL